VARAAARAYGPAMDEKSDWWTLPNPEELWYQAPSGKWVLSWDDVPQRPGHVGWLIFVPARPTFGDRVMVRGVAYDKPMDDKTTKDRGWTVVGVFASRDATATTLVFDEGTTGALDLPHAVELTEALRTVLPAMFARARALGALAASGS